MSSFGQRAHQHDTQALAAVVAVFQAEGYRNYPMGTECDSDDLQKALRTQHDLTSVMFRYRPDQLFILPSARTVCCEIKSDAEGYPNFAVEADAYCAGLEWNRAHRHVMYAFCDLKTAASYGCWADEVPAPSIASPIYVPTWRHEWPVTLQRFQERFGADCVETRDRGGGSGTAYFLVPKPRPGMPSPLRPLDEFVRHDLAAAVTSMNAPRGVPAG